MDQHRIRKSLAPGAWEKLKGELNSACRTEGEASSARLRFRARADGLHIQLSHPKTRRFVSLAFDPDGPCVIVGSHGGPTYYTFRIANDRQEVQLFDPAANRLVRCQDIVAHVTGYLTSGK